MMKMLTTLERWLIIYDQVHFDKVDVAQVDVDNTGNVVDQIPFDKIDVDQVDVDNYVKVVDQVVAGDGVGWLKLSRLRKLMEVVTIIMIVLIIKYKYFDQDENYRNMILPKLNRSLDCAGSPDDHIQDVVRPCECDADMRTS